MAEWRDVAGYEGLYQVSSTGLVRSLPRVEKTKHSRTGSIVYRTRNGRLLKLGTHVFGYKTVALYKDGSVKLVSVHRLVAKAFHPNDDGYKEVNHIDGDPANNKVGNLGWCTRSENILHSTTVLGKNRGSDNKLSKLTEEDVLKIKDLIDEGVSQTQIAKVFNVTGDAIWRISHGHNWSWLTGYTKEVVYEYDDC